MKSKSFLFVALGCWVISLAVYSQSVQMAPEPAVELSITVLYDNYTCSEGTEADWGFSCLVQIDGQDIIFDTGTKADILKNNVEKTQTDLTLVDQAVISHMHQDHTGGLGWVLSQVTGIPVFLPMPVRDDVNQWVQDQGSQPRNHEDPIRLKEHLWLSGTLGDQIPEQCLVIDHENGLIVLTGCSHPGITDMLANIKRTFGKDVYAVMGGFHLMMKGDRAIENIITEFESLGVQKCGCTHCTGEKQIEQFREHFGEDFIEMGTGRVVSYWGMGNRE